ncbi:molybdopterin-dependent oxidoreductase [Litchfieldia alkalitelluris]|uniref:molybdopterin-dependent oxidoreductase n=1 Tax=Litchfieldia alkalitelluris TaxID=304268 RepID=UPI0009972483|nr:molybdopterin-dependent oxidoreductase [Litchfieldia alkalitelluris]
MTNKLPPGQFETDTWPILHQGDIYLFNQEHWGFKLFGEVDKEVILTFKEFSSLPKVISTIDMHCVTTWSKFGTFFQGVPFRELVSLVNLNGGVEYVKIYGYYNGDMFGYSANLPLNSLLGDDALFVDKWGDSESQLQDITPKHGFPFRFIPPASFYLWKGTKWVSGIKFMREDEAGFWEEMGYSMTANPYKEERYR